MISSYLWLEIMIMPVLQSLSGESFRYVTANVEDEARLDVSAHGFWGGRYQWTFLMWEFLILLFLVTVTLQHLHCTCRRFEREKKRIHVWKTCERYWNGLIHRWPHWCSLHIGEWVVWVQLFLRDWHLTCCSAWSTIQLCNGMDLMFH